MNVIYHKQVVNYLNELVDTLYEQNYFGFKESAYNYVNWILNRIENNIAISPHKKAPEYFSKYGKNLYYINIKKNSQTTWYVFFNHETDLFHVHYISNNHMIAKYL
jgi:hypothetical protein